MLLLLQMSFISVQFLFRQEDYPKPLFTVYFKTSLFTIYLVAFLFWRPWQRMCCPKWCRRKNQSVIQQQHQNDPRRDVFNKHEQVGIAGGWGVQILQQFLSCSWVE